MWIVKIALNRPYTFIVLALLILILSPVVILQTPTDIFPSINIPVVAVAWTYTSLSPEETANPVTAYLLQQIQLLAHRNRHGLSPWSPTGNPSAKPTF
jgi:multidrug efflux pump subunit AcrB